MSPLDEVIAANGAYTRPLYTVITVLYHGWIPFDELVRRSAAPRRSVEELLDALGDDLDRDGDRVQLRRDSTGYAKYLVRRLADPFGRLLESHDEDYATLARLIDDVPPPLAALDHVQATPETVLRRGLWLDTHFDLARTRLLFLGDHDLTSFAIRELHPWPAGITVVDVDDRLLAYIDEHSGGSITTLHADLRFGLPRSVTGQADLVFSDPPYTPEGMGLFASRAVQALAEPVLGRIVLAYGYSARHPELGRQVQRELLSLGLTFEAILPEFNRYYGAQAIGSAADLYVCQPTAQARKAGKRGTGIYTHGPQSVETGGTPASLLNRLSELADGARPRGADWSSPITSRTPVALDLTADPGPWLLRALLAVNAPRVALLVPNSHPDLADAAAQEALARLVDAKYRLRYLRSTPDNTHAVVVAEAAAAPSAAGTVLAKAHGKLGNVWREALIEASGGTLTKNEARERIGDHPDLAHRLIDLPRHRVATLLAALAR
ncbi:bis-aminopropyl spermidine synthase family protein [Amycolatopsis anabasis]|uniref:bis-aminopropyl spermidine synthase family protein n=1 Tax=Amycolatopsis anabasis TaxID=1840409 RepID=UPI00131CC88D|nr:bis-aminopropyl spermidine synthase family protein [Amycolatopsis anabasis]